MDEDNKKMRRAARREFQENVRSLVAFVRKRDRRVAAWQQQEELKKQERLAAEERRWACFLSHSLADLVHGCTH